MEVLGDCQLRNMVLGSDGFVGPPLCRYLVDLGEDVVPIDIKRGDHHDARSMVFDLDGIDRVYFLAWDVGGAKYLYDDATQLAQLQWNHALLSNVVPQLSGIPYLFVSSQLAEDCDTVYGVLKRLGEVWTTLSYRGVTMRLWNVYGSPEELTVRSHVVSDFVRQALSTGEIRMLTTGEEKRRFIHISDACRAFHMAFENGARGTFDVSSSDWVSVLEIAKIISGETGCRVIPGRQPGSTHVMSNRGTLPGWAARIQLREGLRRLIGQMRDQGETA